MTNEVIEYPPVIYSHNVKIEQSAKGARVTVHVSATNRDDAIAEAIATYKTTRSLLEQNNEMLAPMELK